MRPYPAGRHVVGWLIGSALAVLLFSLLDCGATVDVVAPVRVYNCSQAPGTVQDSELHCVEVKENSGAPPADAGPPSHATAPLVFRLTR